MPLRVSPIMTFSSKSKQFSSSYSRSGYRYSYLELSFSQIYKNDDFSFHFLLTKRCVRFLIILFDGLLLQICWMFYKKHENYLDEELALLWIFEISNLISSNTNFFSFFFFYISSKQELFTDKDSEIVEELYSNQQLNYYASITFDVNVILMFFQTVKPTRYANVLFGMYVHAYHQHVLQGLNFQCY